MKQYLEIYSRVTIKLSRIHDKFSIARYFPHPLSLSRRERDAKPFSLREKGGDEGARMK